LKEKLHKNYAKSQKITKNCKKHKTQKSEKIIRKIRKNYLKKNCKKREKKMEMLFGEFVLLL